MNDNYKEQIFCLAVAAFGFFILGPALAYGFAYLISLFVP
jgi:hypothetical protein